MSKKRPHVYGIKSGLYFRLYYETIVKRLNISFYQGENMTSDNKIARTVGLLFLISMTASMIYTSFYSSFLFGSLIDVYPNKTQVIIGALLEFINCVAVVGIATFLFSVLKRQNETIARFYVNFRIIECTILIVGIISGLLLISLSQEFLKVGAPDTSYYHAGSILVLNIKHLALQMALIICSIGGLMFTYLLYQSKLIPRFLSMWGFIGYLFVLASALLDIFGIIDTVHGSGMMMYLPGGIFEVILLPIWLIVKGFNSTVVDAGVTHSDAMAH
jgi:hypothetical protein